MQKDKSKNPILRKFEKELPVLSSLNEGVRLGAQKTLGIAERMGKKALRDMGTARQQIANSTNDMDRQAAEGVYLQATDDRQKCMTVAALARRRMALSTRG